MKRKRMMALLEEIDQNPERHYQGSWISGLNFRYETFDESVGVHIPERTKEYSGQLINCGTTGCLAGLGSLRYAPVGTKFWGDVLVLPEGEQSISYQDYGQEVLGLTEREASYLFGGDRSMEEIKNFVAKNKEDRKDFLNTWY